MKKTPRRWTFLEDVNLGQIEAGLAWHYKEYAREQSAEDRKRYAEAEIEARGAQCGGPI
jgi:endonuclease YncB( thermonuclease family)